MTNSNVTRSGTPLEILADRGIPAEDLFEGDVRRTEYISYAFQTCDLDGVNPHGFGPDCFLHVSPTLDAKLRKGQAKLSIRRMGPGESANQVHIYVEDYTGRLSFLIGSRGKVVLGRLGRINLDVRLGHDGHLLIGDKTTVNGARMVAINSTIVLKRDVMLSDEILIQGFDQHGIIDLKTGEFINIDRDSVTIGNHVWLGRRSTIMPGVTVNDGAIVGACSVVTSDVPACSVAAGVPARILRENTSWSRSWTRIDGDSQQFFEDIEAGFLTKDDQGTPQDEPR